MYNIFYVESPLQLMSALNAKGDSKEKAVLIVNLSTGSRKNNDKQINKLINKSDWSKIHFQKAYETKLFCLLNSLYLASLYFFKYKNKINKYYFGEYRKLEMISLGGILNAKETILLDDGSYTITAQKYYISQNKLPFEVTGSATKVKLCYFKTFFGWSFSKMNTPNLYSFFDLKKYMIEDQINYFTPSLPKRVIIEENDIFYFGSKHSEADYVKLPLELTSLNSVFQKYCDKNLYYIPHRDESSTKLRAIEKIGFTIKNLGCPAEEYFNNTKIMPSTVISTYSTTLYSCFIRFENVSVVAIDIRQYIHNSDAKINANNIYPYYKDLGISVEDIEVSS